MVLEIKVPKGADFAALQAGLPIFLDYALSYVNVGIFWNNHHHMLHATERINGRVLWSNLFLLFWLSLIPFVIRWMDEAGITPLPTAAYGAVLVMAAIGYTMLQRAIIAAKRPHVAPRDGTRQRRQGEALARSLLCRSPLCLPEPLDWSCAVHRRHHPMVRARPAYRDSRLSGAHSARTT